MQKRHVIDRSEIRKITVEQLLAAAHGRRLLFRYDIGRGRLSYVVQERGGGTLYDTLDEAIAAYNEGE